MPNNNNSTMELSGSIRLTNLLYANVVVSEGRSWLQIPIEDNPSLFMSYDKKNNNRPVVSLDITIWRNETPKFDNTHYIRASVGKKNGERLTDEQRRQCTMILGNARTFSPRQQAPAAPAAPAPAPGYQPNTAQGYQGRGYQTQGPYAQQPPQGGYQPVQQPVQQPAPQAPGYGQQYTTQPYGPAPAQGFAGPPMPNNIEDLP